MAKSLFESSENRLRACAMPLAARMRPVSLDEFLGQRKFLGEGKLLRRLLAADRLGSVIFYGPPGCGKTTLARLLATESRSTFRQLSAVMSGVKELREVLTEAQDRLTTGRGKTLLFIDEIHRFNKSQQDVLLPEVEEGVIILVGATTENPFFAVNSALISRSRVFQFEPLSNDDIVTLLRRALTDSDRGFGKIPIEADDDALEFLAETSDGDARRALSALEIGVLSSLTPDSETNTTDLSKKSSKNTSKEELNVSVEPIHLTRLLAAESVQRKAIQYDRDGDTHYDTISALIKSVRGSDPDAAIYWLAKMLEGGEDIRFLARRLIILASEDIGNADPDALPLAVATMQACQFIGLPEAQLPLAQTVTYLACAPKSNSATVAIGEARKDVREGRILPVPIYLRDAHYSGAKQLGYEGYQYAHQAADGVAEQDYLGIDREYYRPVERGFEREILKRLHWIRERLRNSKQPPKPPETDMGDS